MRVHTLDPIRDARWHEFVQEHPAASAFHAPAWADALQRTYAYGPVVFTTTPPAEPLKNGVLACRINSWLTGRRLVSVPFADHCEPLIEIQEERAAILGELCAGTGDDCHLELRPQALAPWEHLGLIRGASFVCHTIDLRPSSTAIFQRFHRDSIRRKIARAAREGVTLEQGTSVPTLQAFYRLMVATRRRHGLAPQPIEWFANLIRCFQREVQITLAMHESRAIAGMLTLRHGRRLVYKYGCSDARMHRLGAVPFLFWAVIQDARAAGVESMDLGRSDLDAAGLITFKERLGGVASRLTYLRTSSAHPRNRRAQLRIPRSVVSYVPDRLLVAAGRCLYRHLG